MPPMGPTEGAARLRASLRRRRGANQTRGNSRGARTVMARTRTGQQRAGSEQGGGHGQREGRRTSGECREVPVRSRGGRFFFGSAEAARLATTRVVLGREGVVVGPSPISAKRTPARAGGERLRARTKIFLNSCEKAGRRPKCWIGAQAGRSPHTARCPTDWASLLMLRAPGRSHRGGVGRAAGVFLIYYGGHECARA